MQFYVAHPLKKEKIEIKGYYYFWLSYFCDVSYELLKKLSDVFLSLENIYKISKSNFLFKEYLEEKSICIPSEIYSKLVSLDIKENSKKYYENLIEYNIKVLSFDDAKYRNFFNNIKKYDLCLFALGNLDMLLNKNKIMVHNNFDSNSMYVKNVKNVIYNYIDKFQGEKIEFIENLDYLDDGKIYIFNFKFNKNTLQILSKFNLKNTLVLFSKHNFSNEYKEFNMLLASEFLDKLILLEARYESQNVSLVDNVLDLGKNIYVVPGNILSKSSYFSNYLIKLGAEEILCIDDIKRLVSHK